MAGGTFSGIEMGRLALQNFQTGLHTTGHNISNSKTEGYSRQRVMMRSMDPLYRPDLTREERAGQIGQGMNITSVTRARDEFIDKRITFEKTSAGYWNARKNYLAQIESLHNEPGENNIREDMDKMWEGWQQVADNPVERAPRSVLVERANRVTKSIRAQFGQLRSMRTNADINIQSKTKRINEIGNTIRDLNRQILQSEALGDNPNDLYDRRDLLFEELTNITNATIEKTDPNETMIHIGGKMLVQGDLVMKLEARPDAKNEGMARVVWATTGEDVNFEGGEMKGLLEIRDVDIVHEINKLDAFAINVAETVNELHRDGFGANLKTGTDFFKVKTITPNALGNHDIEENGNINTVLFKVSGVNVLDAKAEVAKDGVLTFASATRGAADVQIAYKSTDKVEDVVDRINKSGSNVVAYLDHRDRLVLKAKVFDDYQKPNFMITKMEDTGGFLSAGGAGVLRTGESFNWNNANEYAKLAGDGRNYSVTPYAHPAEWLEVNEVVRNDVDFVAAASGFDTTGDGNFNKVSGVGNSDIAYAIADIRNKSVMIDSHSTFNEYYADVVGNVGAKMETAIVESEKQSLVIGHLEKMRESISGVNLDEEMAQMVIYQHGYNASARVVSMMDRMLDTVINRMGV